MAKYTLISPNRENGVLSLNESYLKLFKENEAVPVICSHNISPWEYLKIADGIMLTGGGDLSPRLMGEPLSPLAESTDLKRDLFEAELIKGAMERGLPILGICRGAQVLNCALGGKLNQHIEGHRQSLERNCASHSVIVKRDSLLFDIVKKEEIYVNSFHHQCISEPARALKISAVSRDSIPEAVEYGDRSLFCLGVQWHPEALDSKENVGIIKAFLLRQSRKKVIDNINSG